MIIDEKSVNQQQPNIPATDHFYVLHAAAVATRMLLTKRLLISVRHFSRLNKVIHRRESGKWCIQV